MRFGRRRPFHKPLDPEQKVERDPIYTFTTKDEDFAKEVHGLLMKAQKEDPTFYFQYIETRTKHHFRITAKRVDNEHLKKVLFKVGLRSETGIHTK